MLLVFGLPAGLKFFAQNQIFHFGAGTPYLLPTCCLRAAAYLLAPGPHSHHSTHWVRAGTPHVSQGNVHLLSVGARRLGRQDSHSEKCRCVVTIKRYSWPAYTQCIMGHLEHISGRPTRRCPVVCVLLVRARCMGWGAHGGAVCCPGTPSAYSAIIGPPGSHPSGPRVADRASRWASYFWCGHTTLIEANLWHSAV